MVRSNAGRLARRGTVAVVALAGLTLAGCASNAPQDTFKPEGPAARKINNLAIPIGSIALVVLVIVGVAVAFVAIKFRERPDSEVPHQNHGNTKLEIAWTIAPAILLAVIAVPTITTIFDLARKPANPLEISVIGQQWWWEFDYPTDGVVTANEMVIPAQTDIWLSITSRDVIHSFWIPRLAGKKDAVPGRVHKINFRADKPGDYWGQCTEFCGLSHANMRIRVRALSKADYATWLDNQTKDRVKPATDTAQARGEATYLAKCASCHQINGVMVKDASGNEVRLVVDASANLIAGAAPNLTHFATRSVFAGAVWPTYLDDPATKDIDESDPYLTPHEKLIPNRTQLEAWLRNPPGELPMYPQGKRGMPNLKLTEQEINDLSDYLLSLK
jgi:cytochrome c oxidase subunit 2